MMKYDYSCGTFSPDGRIFQLEYATKAVENSGYVMTSFLYNMECYYVIINVMIVLIVRLLVSDAVMVLY